MIHYGLNDSLQALFVQPGTLTMILIYREQKNNIILKYIKNFYLKQYSI